MLHTCSLKSFPFCWLILSYRFPPVMRRPFSILLHMNSILTNLIHIFRVNTETEAFSYHCNTQAQWAGSFYPWSDWSRLQCCCALGWRGCLFHSWHLCAPFRRASSGPPLSIPPESCPGEARWDISLNNTNKSLKSASRCVTGHRVEFLYDHIYLLTE